MTFRKKRGHFWWFFTIFAYKIFNIDVENTKIATKMQTMDIITKKILKLKFFWKCLPKLVKFRQKMPFLQKKIDPGPPYRLYVPIIFICCILHCSFTVALYWIWQSMSPIKYIRCVCSKLSITPTLNNTSLTFYLCSCIFESPLILYTFPRLGV